MMQDGGRAERILELLYGFGGVGVPGQGLGLFLQEGGKRCSEHALVLDESTIEVGKSEESLQVLYSPLPAWPYLCPGPSGFHFGL